MLKVHYLHAIVNVLTDEIICKPLPNADIAQITKY